MQEQEYGERRARVICPECKGEYDSDKVEFLNIEEDFQSRDVMTFKCPNPECLKEVKSLIFLR